MLAIQHLQPGTRIRLKKDHVVATIVDNPGDGTWLMIRRTPSPEDTGVAPGEDLCHIDEVLEVL